jgi:hypothetical protein
MKAWIIFRFDKKIRVEFAPIEYNEKEALSYFINQEGYSDDITIQEEK